MMFGARHCSKNVFAVCSTVPRPPGDEMAGFFSQSDIVIEPRENSFLVTAVALDDCEMH